MGGLASRFSRQHQKQNKNRQTHVEIPQHVIDSIRKNVSDEVAGKFKAEMVNMEMEIAKIRKDLDQHKANILTTNNLLDKKGIFSSQEYTQLYSEVMRNMVGLVDNLNRMAGVTRIFMYNMTN